VGGGGRGWGGGGGGGGGGGVGGVGVWGGLGGWGGGGVGVVVWGLGFGGVCGGGGGGGWSAPVSEFFPLDQPAPLAAVQKRLFFFLASSETGFCLLTPEQVFGRSLRDACLDNIQRDVALRKSGSPFLVWVFLAFKNPVE